MWNRQTASAKAGEEGGRRKGEGRNHVATAVALPALHQKVPAPSPHATLRSIRAAGSLDLSICLLAICPLTPDPWPLIGQIVGTTHESVERFHRAAFLLGKQQKTRVETRARLTAHSPAEGIARFKGIAGGIMKMRTGKTCSVGGLSVLRAGGYDERTDCPFCTFSLAQAFTPGERVPRILSFSLQPPSGGEWPDARDTLRVDLHHVP